MLAFQVIAPLFACAGCLHNPSELRLRFMISHTFCFIVLAYSKQNFSLSRAIVQGPSDRKIMYHSDPSSRKPIFVRKPIAGHKQVQQSSSCKTRTLRLKGLYILTLIFLDECKASLCVENIQHNCDTYDTPWRNCLFDRVLVLVVRGND